MGACFVQRSYDGKLTRAELKQKFAEDQEQARYEDGHSYSGTIGELQGLNITDLEFEEANKAYGYIEERATKNGPGIAVRCRKTRVVPIKQLTFNGEPGYGGAVSKCYYRKFVTASERKLIMADQLTEKERAKLQKLVEQVTGSEIAVRVVTALLDPLRAQLNSVEPLKFSMAELRRAHKDWAREVVALKKWKEQLQQLDALLSEKYTKTRTEDLGMYWIVGGLAAE